MVCTLKKNASANEPGSAVRDAAHEEVRDGEDRVGEEEDAADGGDGDAPGEPQERVVKVAQRRAVVAEDADAVGGAGGDDADRERRFTGPAC